MNGKGAIQIKYIIIIIIIIIIFAPGHFAERDFSGAAQWKEERESEGICLLTLSRRTRCCITNESDEADVSRLAH